MNAQKADKLRKALFKMVQNMRCADQVAQYLYSNKQLSVQVRDEVRNTNSHSDKNRILLNNILCRDTEAFDMMYECLFSNDEIELCQLLWVPSLGTFPHPKPRDAVMSVAAFNEDLERQGLPYRYRLGEDPSLGGDVIDLQS